MQSTTRPYILNLVILVTAALLSVAVGAVFIQPGILLRLVIAHLPGFSIAQDWPETYNTILYQIRLPRVLMVSLTGAALAGSGAAYQGLFRNPLADPYLIGVASGAGLGAVFALTNQSSSSWLGM